MINTRLAAASVAVAALVGACSTQNGGTPAAQQQSSSPPAAPSPAAAPPSAPPPAKPSSAEDQIRETLAAFQEAYNGKNWPAYSDLLCAQMRAQFTGPAMDYLSKSRDESGTTTIKAITNIVITGDTATATIESQSEAMGTRTLTLPLKLEGGWKICRT